MKKFFVLLILLLWPFVSSVYAESSLPSVLLIITDDQRYDDLGKYMPFVQKEIFDRGLQFNNAYVTTPLCCPSRASIYTGMYASKHGVYSNQIPLHQETIIQKIHKEDKYHTGLVGKYLNSSDGTPRSEFDYWVSHKSNVKYRNPKLNINGKWKKKKKYLTDALTDAAIDFFETVPEQKPFFLTVSYFAPHSPTIPDHKDTKKFLDSFTPTPHFNEKDVTDKPSHIHAKAPYSPEEVRALGNIRIKQRQSLASIDRSVKRLLDELARKKKVSDTIIIFLSDNGILLGEHRLWGKRYIYEPAIRIPFAIRYDKKLTPKMIDKLVLNIDIAPTLYELTKTKPPQNVDGVSLLRLLDENQSWRSEFLFEVFQMHRHQNPSFTGLHTQRYVYVWHKLQEKPYEMYDLENDPWQLVNIAYDSRYEALSNTLRRKLEKHIRSLRGAVSLDPPQSIKGIVPESHVEDFKNKQRLIRLGKMH